MVLTLLALAFAQPAADLPGRWYPLTEQSGPLDAADRERIRQLESLGYVGGSEAPPVTTGVVRHEPGVSAGLNLYSSGHRPQAVLMAMDGTVRHTWQADFATAFPDRADLLAHRSAHTWRRVAMLEDGSLLAIHEGLGIVKLDRDSRVLWAKLNQAHHDLQPLDNGHLLVLTRVAHKRGAALPILEDFVTELDADGGVVRSISVLAALESSPFAHLLSQDPDWETGDLLHTNSLQLLDGSVAAKNPAFSAGRLLISSRTQGFVAVLDLDSQRIVWATRGPWSRQHDPQITPTGRLLLFDNRGLGVGRSRVLALDPSGTADRQLWSWAGEPGQPLHSDVLGTVQELANGNVLITESTRGRAIEVDAAGRIVWDYRNPELARGRYIAAIFEMVRLTPDAASFLP